MGKGEPSTPTSSGSSATSVVDAPSYAVNPELEKRARRKLDLHILPVMTIFFFLSFLDRTNIGNARVAGLQHDLGMTEKQYKIIVTVLYVPYILSEIPSNLILKKIGPRWLLPTLLTLWGLITCLQGMASLSAFMAYSHFNRLGHQF